MSPGRAGRTDGAVVVEHQSFGVVTITLRSEPLGVLRRSVKGSLWTALSNLEADSAVRALIITGEGRAFSVGSDVREFASDPEYLLSAVDLDQGLNEALEQSRLPIIAACNGLTLGGGLELALACDIRIAAASAEFGMPELRVGAIASGGGTQRLPRLIGPGRALELLLTGRPIAARQALRIGLINRIVPDEALLESALDLGRTVAANGIEALSATKHCVYRGLAEGRAIGQALERRFSVEVGGGSEAAEGQAAFLAKRPPNFASPDSASLRRARRQ